jgi:hypothetical protein
MFPTVMILALLAILGYRDFKRYLFSGVDDSSPVILKFGWHVISEMYYITTRFAYRGVILLVKQTYYLSTYSSKVFVKRRGDLFFTEVDAKDFTPDIYRMIQQSIERFEDEKIQGKKNQRVKTILAQLAEKTPVPAAAISPAPQVANDSSRGLSRLTGDENLEQEIFTK